MSLLLLIGGLVSACEALEGEENVIPTIDPADAAVAPVTPTPADQPAPSPTPAGWIADLVASGATYELPEQVFLLDGPNVRMVAGDLSVEQVTENIRVKLVSSSPDGTRAAVIYLTEVGSRSAEEVRLVDAGGELSEPIYGPEVVSGPAANPRITGLFWAPDGSRLALSREDGSVWIVTLDGSSEPRQILETGMVVDIAWSGSGTAIAVLAREREDAPGRILIQQVDGTDRITIEPLHSFGAVDWLMGSGQVIYVEEWAERANPLAGSIFAAEPGSAESELLVSAGEFAPRVEIPMLSSSPDGRWLAFPVYAPGPAGEMRFLSLALFELESGLLRRIEVPAAYQVSDLWWSSSGLIWRGIQPGDSRSYTGVEPYVIGAVDLAEGGSRVIYSHDRP